MDGAFHIDTDQPIWRVTEDILGRGDFVQHLCRALVEKKDDKVRARNTVVGLTGPWGSGKSSILNLLAEELGRRDRVIVVRFNPWLFSGRDELVNAFFNELIEKLGRSLRSETVAIARVLSRYKKVVDVAISASSMVTPVLPFAIQAVIDFIFRSKSFSATDLRHEAETYIEKAGIAVVVLIDELDRVEDDEVRAVAQLIKAIGELRGISYLVAYDPVRVIDALGRGEGEERRQSGAAYLEKIVQHAIPLRPLVATEIDILLKGELEKRGYIFHQEENNKRLEEMLDYIKPGLKTPRDIKRFIGTFNVIESMVHDEVNIIDVLGYCYLLVKIPEVHNKLISLFENESKLIKLRVGKYYKNEQSADLQMEIFQIFFKDDYFEPYMPVINYLFPSLFSNSFSIFEESFVLDDKVDRIDRRNNLVRLLYLGNPPNDISKKEIIEILNYDTKSKIVNSLNQVYENGKITLFFNKLNYFIEYLEESNDCIFWSSVVDIFNDESSVIYEQLNDDLMFIRRDLRAGINLFYKKYSYIDDQDKRTKDIIDIMIAAGDLIIVPMIMRRYLLGYGLANLNNQHQFKGDAVLSKEYIESLMESEAKRYRKAICEGTWLKKIPSIDVFNYLYYIGGFDENVKESLTAQLTDKDKIQRFSYIVYDQEIGFTKDMIVNAVDSDCLLSKINKFFKASELNDEGNNENWRVKILYETLKA